MDDISDPEAFTASEFEASDAQSEVESDGAGSDTNSAASLTGDIETLSTEQKQAKLANLPALNITEQNSAVGSLKLPPVTPIVAQPLASESEPQLDSRQALRQFAMQLGLAKDMDVSAEEAMRSGAKGRPKSVRKTGGKKSKKGAARRKSKSSKQRKGSAKRSGRKKVKVPGASAPAESHSWSYFAERTGNVVRQCDCMRQSMIVGSIVTCTTCQAPAFPQRWETEDRIEHTPELVRLRFAFFRITDNMNQAGKSLAARIEANVMSEMADDLTDLPQPDKLSGNECLMWIRRYTKVLDASPLPYAPEMAEVFCRRSTLLACLSAFELSMKDAFQAITLDPTYSAAYFRLGFAYGALGEWNAAAEVFLNVSRVQSWGALCELDAKASDPHVRRFVR